MRSCGECHRHPDMITRASIRTDNIEIVRYQPVGLMQSRCYKFSSGTLSCVTCHDPHAPASRDRTRYEASCRSCHTTAPRGDLSGFARGRMPRLSHAQLAIPGKASHSPITGYESWREARRGLGGAQ